jgi:hypothetical protein
MIDNLQTVSSNNSVCFHNFKFVKVKALTYPLYATGATPVKKLSGTLQELFRFSSYKNFAVNKMNIANIFTKITNDIIRRCNPDAYKV